MTDSAATPPDDDELELEPVDPDILAGERDRAQKKVRQAEEAVEYDDLYEESEHKDPVDFDALKHIRFTTRHLLIAMALLAIFLTLVRLTDFVLGSVVFFVAALSFGWWYVKREESRRTAELERRRKEFNERKKRALSGEESRPSRGLPPVTFEEEPRPERKPFRVAYSVRDLLIAITIAAVLLGVGRWVGGTDKLALLLGLTALAGLVAGALGLDPPKQVTLAWFWLLAIYIGVSLIAAIVG